MNEVKMNVLKLKLIPFITKCLTNYEMMSKDGVNIPTTFLNTSMLLELRLKEYSKLVKKLENDKKLTIKEGKIMNSLESIYDKWIHNDGRDTNHLMMYKYK